MSLVVRQGLWSYLNGDSTLTALLGDPATGFTESIYHNEAPAKASYPFVIFNKQAGTPAYTFGGQAWDNELWMVKGVDRSTSASVVDDIATELDSRLTDGSPTISGKTLMMIRRESDVEYSEVDDGVTYVHAGALYRIFYE